jgi:hypothetical protein
MPSAWRCGCAASGDVEGRAPTAEAVGGAGLTEQGLTVQGEVVTRAPGQSSWLQRRSAEWPWSPWVREQARGRARRCRRRCCGRGRAAAAATQADRRHSTSAERVRGGVPAPDACTCMRVCGVPEVPRRLKNWNKAVWARNAPLTKMDPKTHFQS